MAAPANMLDAMEMPRPEDSSAEIEVLDGQTSVEELLADLGFEWRHGTPATEPACATVDGNTFGQPALF
jgi:hypothetical protein